MPLAESAVLTHRLGFLRLDNAFVLIEGPPAACAEIGRHT